MKLEEDPVLSPSSSITSSSSGRTLRFDGRVPFLFLNEGNDFLENSYTNNELM